MSAVTQPAPPAAGEQDEIAGALRWQRLLMGFSTWIGLVLVALIVVFGAIGGSSFLSLDNVRNLATDASVTLVLATGATFVIITAGIDLSIGSVLVFASVVSVKAMHAVGGNGTGTIVVGLAVALLGGMAWGALNGFLVAKARIPALIVTLGTLGMAYGAALLITHGVDESDVPLKLQDGIGIGRLFGQIPYLVVIGFGVALAGGIILAATRFGRYTYAIGANSEATRRAGVAIDRHLIKVYGLAGTLAGLGGFLALARFATTTVAGHSNDNLYAIAAVVIGGTSLFGGVGTMLGTAFGVLIQAVLQNGFIIIGLQQYWQYIAIGAAVIGAVYLDQVRRQSLLER